MFLLLALTSDAHPSAATTDHRRSYQQTLMQRSVTNNADRLLVGHLSTKDAYWVNCCKWNGVKCEEGDDGFNAVRKIIWTGQKGFSSYQVFNVVHSLQWFPSTVRLLHLADHCSAEGKFVA